MANAKISQLPSATTPLAGSELVEIVQGGINKQVTAQDVADLGGGGGAVDSVNGQTGVVVLDAGDVGALPLSGGTMSGNIAMGNNKLTGLAAGSSNGDSVRFEQLPAAASASVSGIGKLYTGTGTNTDGSMTQNAITNELRKTRTITTADSLVQSDDNSFIIFNSGSPMNFTLDQITASSKVSFLNIGAGIITFVAGTGVTITGETTLLAAVGTSYPTAVVFYHTATTPRVIVGSF